MLATRTAAAAALPSLAPFLAYLRLEVRRSLRNRRYLVFTIVFPVMLYVLYTAVILPATANGHARRPALAGLLPRVDGRLRRDRRRDEPGRPGRHRAAAGLGAPAARDAAARHRVRRGQGRLGRCC